MAGISVSKSLTYAVVTPPSGIDVTKALSYAVVIPYVLGVSVTKASAYAVLADIATSAERAQILIFE